MHHEKYLEVSYSLKSEKYPLAEMVLDKPFLLRI